MIRPGSTSRGDAPGDARLRRGAGLHLLGVVQFGVASALVALTGCGSSNLTTDEVTVCSVDACTSARPAGASPVCRDGSVAGPSCIRHMDGTCGWAILTCPIERGPTGGKLGGSGGSTAVGGQGESGGLGTGGIGVPTGGVIGTGGYIPTGGVIGSGGYIPTGGVIGTGGRRPSTGGVIGSGGYIPTGGVIGTGGGRPSTGGVIGSGGYIPTGGVIGTGGYIPTGGVVGTGGYIPTGGVIGTGGYNHTGGVIGRGGGYGSGGATSGSFAWTGGGISYSAVGYYEENLAISGTAFIITIASENNPFGGGTPCMIVGQFPTVPPAAGTYPIGDYDAARVDGMFVGLCTNLYSGPDLADRSVSGTVVLAESRAGLVEGSFTMHSRPASSGTGGISGNGPLITYAGAFSAGCRDNRPVTDPACAARTIGSP
jgi:hypothetical protein